jgi:MFS transporter, NNP family, nitrate/nitrite transporter
VEIRALEALRKQSMKTGFLKAGHLPTLFASFLYFDLSFMVWVMLGPLAVLIAKDIGLNAAQKGLIVATPVLAGAFLRIVAGVIAQHIGPKRAGILAQSVVILSLGAAWWIGLHSFTQVLLVGVALGVAGASFAIALPLTSQWYPPEHQGTALGIAGAGNSGTVLAALFAPSLAVLFGWRNVLGLAALPLVAVLAVFLLLAKDCPQGPAKLSLTAYFKVLAVPEAWILMLFYSVTFGGFVGLASSLPIYFHDQYGLSPVVAGYVTAACVFTGSMLRPIGGAIADRIGGLMTLSGVYLVAFIALITVAAGVPTMGLALAVFVVAMGSLGMGNGAVFQLVPQRFRSEVAIMTGLVGMTGGIGGFYLASSLGFSKYLTGTYAAGFAIFAGLALVALVGVLVVLRKDRTWTLAVSSVPAE